MIMKTDKEYQTLHRKETDFHCETEKISFDIPKVYLHD